ncbi:SCO family protein [Salipaludibacillus agaradhaerens]|uniref:SCO family protein n=1 Tax=Salipaludibacillus agaradhaerens TaxID=76935 RepID=UPI002151752F|nr:SCO family protein [Salipaludibacillus agaradhaerens]MCR6107367.1 SCO family protein [Salipaludibacillus agaradhaerens]MCR6119396.1 SCO family protein [Salipaludibacillus agaradhaerens]UJW58425.1 SCO family protein [Bacillus sp. A116_S68]
MKKHLLFGGLITVILLISGCSFLYEDTSESSQSEAVIDVSTAEEAWEITDFVAVNQDGEDVTNESLEGEWWLTKTIFTRCPTVCMVMTPNMAELQQALEEEEVDVRIVSFTVDPEFDTPERLKDYGEAYGANFETWDFLTGYTFEDINTLTLDSLKAPLQKIPEQNDIMHPTRFYLVNPDGQIVRMYSGESSFDLDVTVDDIKSVVNQ